MTIPAEPMSTTWTYTDPDFGDALSIKPHPPVKPGNEGSVYVTAEDGEDPYSVTVAVPVSRIPGMILALQAASEVAADGSPS
jgi:hypothetical protein